MKFPTKLKSTMLITTFIGSLSFVLLTIIAMIFYPGGTFDNHSATRYIFLENYFSDLGRAQTFLGESNIISRVLFTVALTLVALSLILYFLVLPTFFTENKIAKWLVIIGSVNGIFAAIAYCLIGFLPYDIFGSPHTYAVYVAFSASILTTIVYTIAIFLEKGYPNGYAWVYVAFTIILAGYLFILFTGPAAGTDLGHSIQVVGQKVIVYTEVVSFGVQALGATFLLKKETSQSAISNEL